MGKPGNTGFRRVVRATRYSAQGLAHAWRHEAAFRQEVVLSLMLLPAALWLGQSPLERMLLIASCLFVLVVELLNSAVEAAIDRFGGEQHELSGRAKDMGSAAVMMSLMLSGGLWLTIIWQRFA
ncbi:MAG: diacylglycerol kinase [Pseudomonadota bacterium]